MPLLADVGIEPGEPEVFEVHNIIRRWLRGVGTLEALGLRRR
jgi:hypothetical protein